MKNIIKRILTSGTLPILLIRVFNTMVVTIVLILLSRQLTTEAYGQYISFWSTLTMAIAVGSIGMASVLYNFSLRGWLDFYKRISPSSLGLYFIFTCVLATLSSWLLYHLLDESSLYLCLIIAILICFSIYSFVIENVLIITQNTYSQLLLNILYSILFLYFHYQYGEGFITFIALIEAYVLLIGIKLGLQFILFKSSQKKHIKSLTYSLLPSIQPDRNNWIQMSINEVFQFVMRYMDKFVVNILATKELAAIYFNGRQDIPFLSAIYSSLGHGLLIELSKKFHIQDEDVIKSMKTSLSKLGSLIITIVVFAWVYSHELFTVVFTEKYIDSIPIFKWGLLLLPAQYLICITYILQYKNHSKIINKGAYLDAGLILLMVIPAYYILGISGIIVSIVISTYIQNIYYAIKIGQIFHKPVYHTIPYIQYLYITIINLILAWGSHKLLSPLYTPTHTLIIGVGLGGILAGVLYYAVIRKQQQENIAV